MSPLSGKLGECTIIYSQSEDIVFNFNILMENEYVQIFWGKKTINKTANTTEVNLRKVVFENN